MINRMNAPVRHRIVNFFKKHNSLIYSFISLLPNTYCMPGTILGSRNTERNNTKGVSTQAELTFLQGETETSKKVSGA